MESLADEITVVQPVPTVERMETLSPADVARLMGKLSTRCTLAQLVEVLHVTLFAMREHVQDGVSQAVEGNGDLTTALQRYQDINDALRAAMSMFSAREIGQS